VLTDGSLPSNTQTAQALATFAGRARNAANAAIAVFRALEMSSARDDLDENVVSSAEVDESIKHRPQSNNERPKDKKTLETIHRQLATRHPSSAPGERKHSTEGVQAM